MNSALDPVRYGYSQMGQSIRYSAMSWGRDKELINTCPTSIICKNMIWLWPHKVPRILGWQGKPLSVSRVWEKKGNKSTKIFDVDIRKKMSQWLSRRKPWSGSATLTLTSILSSFALLLFTLIWQTLSLNEFSPLSRIPKEKPYLGKVMINPWLCTLSMTSAQSWLWLFFKTFLRHFTYHPCSNTQMLPLILCRIYWSPN